MLSTRCHLSTSSSLPTYSFPRLAVGIGLLLLGLVLAPNRVQAQQDALPHWTQHIDPQVAALVKSSNPAVRADGMRLLVNFSPETDASVDFSETRTALYSVLFNRTHSEEQRILALSALHTISGDRMRQVLADRVDEVSSDRVRRHVLLALTEHA